MFVFIHIHFILMHDTGLFYATENQVISREHYNLLQNGFIAIYVD